jgi:hypothetical protein
MSLQFWYDAFEALAAVGAALVVRGLILEYGKGLIPAFKFWKSGHAEVSIETARMRRGAVLVLLGVTAEFFGATGVWVTSDRIETQHRREIATMQSLLAWRSLSVEQQKAIGQACSGLPNPKSVLMRSLNGDAEAYFLSQDIIDALASAKPSIGTIDDRDSMIGDWIPPNWTTRRPFTGVGIMGPTSEHDFMKRASDALKTEGHLKNVLVFEQPLDPKTGKPTGTQICWIVVGPKPVERPGTDHEQIRTENSVLLLP